MAVIATTPTTLTSASASRSTMGSFRSVRKDELARIWHTHTNLVPIPYL